MKPEEISPRAARIVWSMIEDLAYALEAEYVSGEHQVAVLVPVMVRAADLGYDLETAIEVFGERDKPWWVEAARLADVKVDEKRRGSDGSDENRGTAGERAGSLPELSAVPAARPGAARGRRPGPRPGAGQSAG